MNIRKILLPLICGLAFVGCISKQNGVPMEEPVFRNGVTTARDVVEQWGNPDRVRGNEWTWRESRSIGSKVKGAYYGVGLTVANSASASREWRLLFDDNGLLISSERIDSLPDGAAWSPVPFK